MRPRGLTAAALLAAILCASADARPAEGDRVEVLESRLMETLDADLGPGKSKVFIRTVDAPLPDEAVGAEAAQEPESRSSRGEVLWDRIERRRQEAPPVLPGYRVPSDLRAEALRSLKEELREGDAAPRTAPGQPALSVSLMLDSDVDPEAAERARSATVAALGLDPDRGDSLKVSRILRRSPARRPPLSSRLRETSALALVYGGPPLLLLALAAGLMAYFRPSRRARAAEPAAPPARARRAGGLILPGPRHEAAAALTLQTETTEVVVEALRCMSCDSAAGVYRRLPEPCQLSAARALLAHPTEPGVAPAPGGPYAPGTAGSGTAPAVGVYERLRASLEAYENGEGLLAALLPRCPEARRESLLSRLQTDFPAEILRLRREIPTLGDLAEADPPSLRTCLSAFSCDELALCLYELPSDQRDRILAALPGIVRDMVQEKSRRMVPETSELVEAARTDVVTRWRRLELCGRVRPLRGAPS